MTAINNASGPSWLTASWEAQLDKTIGVHANGEIIGIQNTVFIMQLNSEEKRPILRVAKISYKFL